MIDLAETWLWHFSNIWLTCLLAVVAPSRVVEGTPDDSYNIRCAHGALTNFHASRSPLFVPLYIFATSCEMATSLLKFLTCIAVCLFTCNAQFTTPPSLGTRTASPSYFNGSYFTATWDNVTQPIDLVLFNNCGDQGPRDLGSQAYQYLISMIL